MINKAELTISNFGYYAFHPFSEDLSPTDQKIALLGTVLLGLTCGIGHLICRLFFYNRKIEKIDTTSAAQNNANSQQSSSLINRVSNLEIDPGKVTVGQGEYVVFHQLLSGEKKQLSLETFEQVYKILLEHSPAALINSKSEKATEDCVNRYELIKTKLKKIDPTLKAVFIPRTLYELFFIEKCINEDLREKNICPLLKHFIYGTEIEEKEAVQKQRKCWHLCYFNDPGDSEETGVKSIAYRLNKGIVKNLDPSTKGFSYQELTAFAEKKIKFLKGHYKGPGEKIWPPGKEPLVNCSTPGPTTNFGVDSTRGNIKPMGIRNETDAQLIRNAIALECSKTAQYSLFLYRGADFQKDSSSCWSDKDVPYSISYGSSLFAGCLYDGGATAFYYMRNGKNAYAIPVPFDQLNDSPFFVPTTHTVAQLFGDGEVFHARTKSWKDFDITKIGGMNWGANSTMVDHLNSNLTKDALTVQFQTYKDKAFQLK